LATTPAKFITDTLYPESGVTVNTTLVTVLRTIFNRKIQKINDVTTASGSAGVISLNLYDLFDVSKTVSGAVAGNVLNFDGSKWQSLSIDQVISIKTGTLALRPADPTVTSVYIISNDPTNDGRTFIYDITATTPSWLEIKPQYSLNDLTDVVSSGAVTGDTIVFNGTNWVPAASGLNTLDALNDVSTSGAITGSTIIFNGTSWVASGTGGVPSLAILSDTSGVNSAVYGDILSFDGSKWIPTRSDLNNTLDELYDVIVSGAVTNDLLTFNGTNWVPTASGITSLATLSDTSGVNSALAGDILYFNGSKWIPTRTDLDHTLDELYDVIVSGAVINDLLTFNGTNWVPGTVTVPSTLDDLSDVVVSGASLGNTIVFDGTNWVPSQALLNLDDLLDVVSSGAVAGNSLIFTGTNWVASGTGGALSNLGDLLDVNTSGAVVGNTIIFNGTGWIVSGTNGGVTYLSSLLDVNTSGVQDRSGLIYDASVSGWVINNSNFSQESLSFTASTPPPFNTVLPGTVWIDNSTLDQYIYIKDASGNDVWVSLGAANNIINTLSGLSDVIVTGAFVPQAGYSLVFNGTSWIPSPSGTNGFNLDDLLDVVTSGVTTGNTIIFNGTNWVPAPSGTSGSSYLSSLLDVDVTSVPPVSGSSLVYNAVTNKWETNLQSFNQSGIAFTSPNPPSFSSVIPGTIWVDDATFDQYIYIQDSSGTPQWISLGVGGGGGGSSYLSTLLDVDVTTVPPASGSSLVYNAVTNKWETNLNSITQSSISFTSATPPAFSSVVPGTIWIDNSALDQYVYIKDASNNDVWVSLGVGSGASAISSFQSVLGSTVTPTLSTWTDIVQLSSVLGTLQINYNIRYSSSGNAVLRLRLYNSTTSTLLNNSEVKISLNNTDSSYSGTYISSNITTSSNIVLQAFVTGSSTDILSDFDGKTLINNIRIS
jgi:hypothetical protein